MSNPFEEVRLARCQPVEQGNAIITNKEITLFHVRDCAGVAQQEHQEWASEMQDFLLDLHDACQEWRLLHLTAVPAIERDEWVARYFEILAAGFAAQPPPPASSAGSRQGSRLKHGFEAEWRRRLLRLG